MAVAVPHSAEGNSAEAPGAHDLQNLVVHRIKSLWKALHEGDAVALDDGFDREAVRERGAKRLFAQHGLASRGGRFDERQVIGGRRTNRYRITLSHEVVAGRKGLDAVLLYEAPGECLVR